MDTMRQNDRPQMGAAAEVRPRHSGRAADTGISIGLFSVCRGAGRLSLRGPVRSPLNLVLDGVLLVTGKTQASARRFRALIEVLGFEGRGAQTRFAEKIGVDR